MLLFVGVPCCPVLLMLLFVVWCLLCVGCCRAVLCVVRCVLFVECCLLCVIRWCPLVVMLCCLLVVARRRRLLCVVGRWLRLLFVGGWLLCVVVWCFVWLSLLCGRLVLHVVFVVAWRVLRVDRWLLLVVR